jgi:hypothetical protein
LCSTTWPPTYTDQKVCDDSLTVGLAACGLVRLLEVADAYSPRRCTQSPRSLLPVPGLASLRPAWNAAGVEPSDDGCRTHLIVVCEDSDAAAGLVSFCEVDGDFRSGEEAEVLGSGGEGAAPDSEGPGGGCDGPVVLEGVADLGFAELMTAVGLASERGDPDPAEAGLDAVAGHPCGFG